MWFLVDKLGGGGLDDWEVKIADFVVLLGKDAKTVHSTLSLPRSDTMKAGGEEL